MKIVAFSDLHWRLTELTTLPKCYILIYAGDWCYGDSVRTTMDFAYKLRGFDAKYKIVIAGNHDILAENNPSLVKNIFNENGVIYLQDSGITIDGINFWGSPWTPEFNNWAFMKEDRLLKYQWDKIPRGTDVLITHGPPFSILDKVNGYTSVGSETLESSVLSKKPKIHIFGHIHEGYGKQSSKHTDFYNVSIVNEKYELVNKPVEIEL
jgi:Icc-related predicted phosphoesterase